MAAEETANAEVPAPPKSPGEAWRQMPDWTKVLCIGILAIVVASLFVHAVTAHDSLFRRVWGLLQFLMGLGVFALFHAIAAIKASMANNKMGVLEALMNPAEAWRPTIEALPQTARRIWMAAWGLTAAICAMFIVGGIRYSALIDDWGFKKRVDSALTSHVRSSSKKKAAGVVPGAVDLQSGAHEGAESHATLPAESAQRGADTAVLALDCVIVGYNINPRDGTLANLLLASLVDGDLQYVGKVSKGFSDDVGQALARRLAELKKQVPVVKCRGAATWVKPVVAVKATFAAWTDDKMMIDPEFQELMAELDYVE
ncbi:MAG TPA: hypothetical protein VGH74_23030, partial [Planctomycetaceae bacterium]|jgi:hypothetical protein